MRLSSFLAMTFLPVAIAAPLDQTPTRTLVDRRNSGDRHVYKWVSCSNDYRSNTYRERHHNAPHPLGSYRPQPSASKRPKPRPSSRSLSHPSLEFVGDGSRCPADMLACPSSPISPQEMTLETEWECIAPLEDLYTCGGCATLGTGKDCTAIPGVLSVSCSVGACVVHTCRPGLALTVDGKACVEGLIITQLD